MASNNEVIETTVAGELIPGRRAARAQVVAAGLSDEDIDRLIDEARQEAQPLIK